MKTAIITGASGGIGSAIAKKLANLGYSLALVYNKNEKSATALKTELVKTINLDLTNENSLIIQKNELNKTTDTMIIKADLTNENEVREMIEIVLSKYKKIDLLINCAGVSLSKQIQDTTIEDYKFIFDNNVLSTILTTKYTVKNMISNKYGRIINISSIWGNYGASMESLYSSSKGAINSFTMALSKELGPSNITVNAISPGLIDTKMNTTLSDEDKRSIISSTPMQRIGTPDDVANAVAFLAGENSSFVTGQILTISGGFLS